MTGLAIYRGATMADIIGLIENDKADSRKLNPHYVARCQSRSEYAWTWRRADKVAAICAGLAPVGPQSNVPRLETWFTCRPDLTPAELHGFILFAQLVLWCVWRDRRPVEFVAWVSGKRSAGARIARLIGFKHDADLGGQCRVIWTGGLKHG